MQEMKNIFKFITFLGSATFVITLTVLALLFLKNKRIGILVMLVFMQLNDINVELSDVQIEQFYNYMNILIEWNKIMNLTGITEPKEVVIKHFIDSLTVLNKIFFQLASLYLSPQK